METEPHIVFEGLDPSEFLQSRIRSEIEKLERFFGRLTSARVVLSKPHKRRQHGDLYAISVHLAMPDGREVHVTRNPPTDHAHEDAHVALRDAFAAARRKLQDEARKMHGDVKPHEAAPEALVSAIVAEQDYGFLESADGREIYFHKNSVANGGFAKLAVGARVTYSETLGEKGPQATFVRPL